MSMTTLESSWTVFYKLNTHLPFNLAILLVVTYPEELKYMPRKGLV
jgi:hypothetical protein